VRSLRRSPAKHIDLCRKTRFSASSVALVLKRGARIPRISLNRSVIRMPAYAVPLLRLRRIEFSVHTALRLIPEANFAAKKLAKPANEQQVWMGKHEDGELPNAQ
jgi:hypothetical protein